MGSLTIGSWYLLLTMVLTMVSIFIFLVHLVGMIRMGSWTHWLGSSLILEVMTRMGSRTHVVEKPQEVDESFPLARQVCGVPGVSAGIFAAVPDDLSR
jgi:hypothetical protein